SPALIKKIISIGSDDGDVVLDFFAGSATTAHAVYELNAETRGARRFIIVQLPEPTRVQKENGSWRETAASKAGFKTIAELAKKRLRRAAAKLKEKDGSLSVDLGFRVFKLASSNIRAWE